MDDLRDVTHSPQPAPTWEKCIRQLQSSSIPEEAAFAEKALERIQNLHRTLTASSSGNTALLYYLDGDHGTFDVAWLPHEPEKLTLLLLDKTGQWLVKEIGRESANVVDKMVDEEDAHLQFPIGEILEALHTLLGQAEDAKRKRLESVAQAEHKLKELGAPVQLARG